MQHAIFFFSNLEKNDLSLKYDCFLHICDNYIWIRYRGYWHPDTSIHMCRIYSRCRKEWKHAENLRHFLLLSAISLILLSSWTAGPCLLVNMSNMMCNSYNSIGVCILWSFLAVCNISYVFLEGELHTCYLYFFISHVRIHCIWWEIKIMSMNMFTNLKTRNHRYQAMVSLDS